jgi:hypothetical protein
MAVESAANSSKGRWTALVSGVLQMEANPKGYHVLPSTQHLPTRQSDSQIVKPFFVRTLSGYPRHAVLCESATSYEHWIKRNTLAICRVAGAHARIVGHDSASLSTLVGAV